ncbi:MAG TPA: hypothetical protein VML55_26910, partial [Planctomycetaceae bacterium]|nr:hypothetical protein [Planctomycetaceae bacterium]
MILAETSIVCLALLSGCEARENQQPAASRDAYEAQALEWLQRAEEHIVRLDDPGDVQIARFAMAEVYV